VFTVRNFHPGIAAPSWYGKETTLSNADQAWHHCSSHGTVLVHIAANPHTTTNDIADALCLTRRSVWGTIGALRQSGQIRVLRIGRQNHYYVNLDAPFRHPTVTGLTLGDFLGSISREPAPMNAAN
jgi:biotin operon repressor